MKRLFLACSVAAAAFCAGVSPLALVVLNTAEGTSGKLPAGWRIKVNRGQPDISMSAESNAAYLRLRSVKASFALERSVDIDLAATPYLAWKWKVTELPRAGDFRKASTDDQAAQLMVAFTDRRVISYIWDTTAPKGSAQKSGFIPFVNVFAMVCQSGPESLNRWIDEVQHVAADYQRAYGRPAPRVKGLRIQINSQHTGTNAESYFGQVAFRASAH